MARHNQHTIAGSVELHGIGVHSGSEAALTIKPAPEGSGIVFVRTDLDDPVRIPARLEYVTSTELGTSLGNEGVDILTVEHLLAALAALEVDNALLEVNGPEVPILDGSFAPYFDAVDGTGRRSQSAKATIIEVSDAITIEDGHGASYVAVPHDGFRVSATIDFSHGAIGRQHGAYGIDEGGFRNHLAAARTFGFRADADALHARGLALGASLENTVVLDGERVLNGSLRYPDEFVRHKAGDLVGDLALMGGRFRGHIIAERPSHGGNVALARAIRDSHDSVQRAGNIDVKRILDCLPHRYPMLLVDRIVEFEPGKRIVGLKNVTINEPFFPGHFPDHPIMPGVLIVEAMGQVGGLLLMEAVEDPDKKVVYFMSLDNVKWRRPVIPGDQILFEVEMINLRRSVCKMRGKGTVDGKVVAEADMMARIVDR